MTITAVTGLGRSGTSLVMQMLHAGGMPVIADDHTIGCNFEAGIAQAPIEHRKPAAEGWHGHAIKMLEPGVWQPPTGHAYRFIWCHRKPQDQALAQFKFIKATQKKPDPHAPSFMQLVKAIQKSTRVEQRRLKSYPASKLLVVNFRTLLAEPLASAAKLAHFCDMPDADLHASAAEVIPRDPGCYRGFLEVELIARYAKRIGEPVK